MLWCRANSTALKPLNILLNRALRCINFLGRRDKKTSQIYFEQKILKIQDMFKLELAKFCFKFHNKLLPNQLLTVFTNLSSVHNYNTMNSNIIFFRNKQNNKAGFTTLNNLGSKLWNEIPEEIRSSKSVNIFCKNFKNYLLKDYQV